MFTVVLVVTLAAMAVGCRSDDDSLPQEPLCTTPVSPQLDGTDGRPLVCATGAFRTAEQEADTTGDYVALQLWWQHDESLGFEVTSDQPTVDNVFVAGASVPAWSVEPQRCLEERSSAGIAFSSTADAGTCLVEQKIAPGAPAATFEVSVVGGSATDEFGRFSITVER